MSANLLVQALGTITSKLMYVKYYVHFVTKFLNKTVHTVEIQTKVKYHLDINSVSKKLNNIIERKVRQSCTDNLRLSIFILAHCMRQPLAETKRKPCDNKMT